MRAHRGAWEGCGKPIQKPEKTTESISGKFTARISATCYIPHAEIVNGTRIVEQLRQRKTQLTTFMYYGNFFVGKLLEAKHIGQGTFTDVGTTYKLCRNQTVKRLLPALNPAVNLEFNAHFLDVALREGVHMVECPVTFHERVGASKGGNRSNWTALLVGLRMIRGLVFGWKRRGT